MRPRFALAAQFGWVISGLGNKSLSSVIRPRRREQQQREQQHPLSLLVRQRSVASFSQREREREREGEELAHTWVIGAACAFARQPKGASQETATGAAVAGVGGAGGWGSSSSHSTRAAQH